MRLFPANARRVCPSAIPSIPSHTTIRSSPDQRGSQIKGKCYAKGVHHHAVLYSTVRIWTEDQPMRPMGFWRSWGISLKWASSIWHAPCGTRIKKFLNQFLTYCKNVRAQRSKRMAILTPSGEEQRRGPEEVPKDGSASRGGRGAGVFRLHKQILQ